MIIKELEQIEKEKTKAIEDRDRYKYSELYIAGRHAYAKKSCNLCYGSGVYGKRLGNPKKKTEDMIVFCNCIIFDNKKGENLDE